MEWNVKLRRTQSLKSVSEINEKPDRSAVLSDKTMSVSDLVARYQISVGGSPVIQTTPTFQRKAKKAEEVTVEKASSTQNTPLKSILKKTEEKSEVKTNLTPAKSMDSLQSNNTVSIMSLRALYEAKVATPDKEKSSTRAANASQHMKEVPVMNGEARDAIVDIKNKKSIKAVQNVAKTQTKQEHVDKKAVNVDRVERRKTIAGIDFERSAASEADERRKSIADLRDIQTKEKLSVSVKVMSALYLSKVTKKEPTNTSIKPEQNRSPDLAKRGRSFQFQATSQEMCSACMKPVYQMEKITADKYTYHKNCFCCKKCKKKLSVSNYTPANGEFYCIFHYQQLFKRKGNYDEGFGHTQHKNRWLLKSTSSQDE